MQSAHRPGRSTSKRQQPVAELEGVELDVFDEEPNSYDTFEMYRVICPDCAQPIALLADEENLPEHALCASPWNPFGLTVCAGTGRSAVDASPADESFAPQEQHTGLLLTLPQGLNWRTQPFSHAGGPGSRPMRLPAMRHQAA
ncbi:hypothetical protein LK07_04960 [Streptomyces pluripotens]|uniref:Uncharacterized protein n=1 Tax=Streptomyces pluripotens TaxID=1355015 RepID=A0A221NU55_9ACTN|nr:MULTISPECIES: hypothetical protein [Streptomyces]ARP69219.1 hypothetical protein LK06_003875 [Streptomyces pluripotens]ASN23480.1 hypothetical protein LK07_04960 [Streptomyces pluripotens]KIE28475.1 hypothetical protein LK08_03770 [Streptomyces sp. MUSC 125]MCH0555166.1 hypothetical protein [Streptomyces sp. MUM 16J]